MKNWMSRMCVCPLFLFLIPCLAGPLAAKEAPSPEGFLESLGSLEKGGDRLLFYELPQGIEANEGTTVDIRIQHQGRLFVHEKLTLGAVEPGARSAIEILGWNPEKLDELWRLAGEPGSRLKISITVNGRRVADLSFAQLSRQNEDLRQWGFQPVQATSEILSPHGDSSLLEVPQKTDQQDCFNQCADEYYYCAATCDPYDPHDECGQCRTNDQQCTSFCSGCPYTGANQTQTVILSIQPTGYRTCQRDYRDLFSNQGWDYIPVNVNRKVTVYRLITRCDSTTYTQTVSVSYYTTPCWGRTLTKCPNPFGRPSCGIELNYH